MVEIDVWSHRRRVEVRHERRVPLGVPLLFEKWYLRRPSRGEDQLGAIVNAIPKATGLFLDLKDRHPEGLASLARTVAANGHRRVIASSQLWPALRDMAVILPGIEVYYSVDVRAKLALLLSVTRRDRVCAGVSARASLLDPATIQTLHDCGLQVVAWTVDDPARAVALADAGVDGITTHDPRGLRTALAR